MGWLVEPFEPEFMQRALLAGILASTLSAIVGTWVVVRGLTFIGDALAHGVIPGLAVAALVGFDLTLGAALSAAAMVAVLAAVRGRTPLPDDAAIGLTFVGMLALGVIVISRSASFATDLTAFLFGDVLGVTDGDLVVQAVVTVVVLVASVVLHRPLLALALDETKAAALGLRPRLTHAVLLGLVALAVVASFRTVGSLLVFGLLVAPPATASLVARRVPVLMAVAVLAGWISVTVGLLVSFHLDTAAGATMAGVAVAGFFVVLLARGAAGVWSRATAR